MINKIKIGLAAATKARNERELKRLQNKCEQLSRHLTRLKFPFCACDCGKPSTDWCHAVPRHNKALKYHPLNTFGAAHECHLKIDHSPIKRILMRNLMDKIIGPQQWVNLQIEGFAPFDGTIDFYNNMIQKLETAIKEVG
jgi:hypothetical protein